MQKSTLPYTVSESDFPYVNMIKTLYRFVDWTSSEIRRLEQGTTLREFDGPEFLKMFDDLHEAEIVARIFAGSEIVNGISEFYSTPKREGSEDLEFLKSWQTTANAMIARLLIGAKKDLLHGEESMAP